MLRIRGYKKQKLLKKNDLSQTEKRMVHYLPYCSKYNPIEHCCFSQITRTWRGVPFYKIQFVKELTDSISTATGLSVISFINSKEYRIKRPVDVDFKNNFNNQITLVG
jgi:hypothetical protein